MKYKCVDCGKEFNFKGDLNRHLNRKNPCKNQIKNNDNICKICGKSFKSYKSLWSHLNRKNKCVPVDIEEQTEINNITQNIYQNIQNTQNNTHYHMSDVKMVKFGDEDLSFIKDDVYKKLINSGFKSVPNFIEHIHFNKEHPQNHNIYISNMRNSYILIYDGEKWELKERDEVIEDLMNSKTDLLLEKFDQLTEELPKTAINKFKRFIDKKDDDNIINKIKNEIKLILYNNRGQASIKKTSTIDDDEDDKLLNKTMTLIENLDEEKLKDIDESKLEDIYKMLKGI